MAPTLEPEVVTSDPRPKPAKRRRAQVRYKIRGLPPAVHRELDQRLHNGAYGSFQELSDWLERDHAQYISPSSLAHYWKHEFDATLQAVKIATAQAAEILRATDGDEEQMNLAMFRLMQTAIFDLLAQINKTRHLVALIPRAAEHSANRLRKRADAGPATEEDPAGDEDRLAPKYPTRVELAAVTALAKTVATVSKAQIEFKKWRDYAREKVEKKVAATTARVSEAARDGGLSAAAEKSIRNALMEIKL